MPSPTHLIGASLLCFTVATLVMVASGLLAPSALQVLVLLILAGLFYLLSAGLGVIGFVWYLARSVTSTAESTVKEQGARVQNWADEKEKSDPRARAMNLSEVVSPLDRRTEEERTADALDEIQSRYVDGELTDDEFERELARLFELDTEEVSLDGPAETGADTTSEFGRKTASAILIEELVEIALEELREDDLTEVIRDEFDRTADRRSSSQNEQPDGDRTVEFGLEGPDSDR